MRLSLGLLGAVDDVTAGGPKVQRNRYLGSGRLPVVDQGKEFISGFTDDLSCRFQRPGPLVIFGDHTKVLKYVDFPFAIGADGVKVLRAKQGFDAKFVYHYLRTVHLPDAGYSRHFKFLKSANVPQPPLDEQRRIAAILDKADGIRIKQKRVVDHLGGLADALFLDMFGDPDLALASRSIVRFGDVADLQGGRNLVADDQEAFSEFRVLKISAVTSGQFRPAESKALPSGYRPPADHLVRSGDLLISRANTSELVGAVAYVEDSPPNLVLPDKIWRFVWRDEESVPLYYRALFRTGSVRRRISQLSSGTGGSMKNISKAKLAELELPRVSSHQQREFARRIEAIPVPALSEFDELFVSLQSRAFRGELSRDSADPAAATGRIT